MNCLYYTNIIPNMKPSWCEWLLYYFKKYPKEPEEVDVKKNDDVINIDENYYLGEFDDYIGDDEGPIWF